MFTDTKKHAEQSRNIFTANNYFTFILSPKVSICLMFYKFNSPQHVIR